MKPKRNIQENIMRLAEVLEAVKAHPMCARMENNPHKKVTIYFPLGDFGTVVGGIRADKTSAGLTLALNRMEKIWKESFPGYKED